MPLPRPPPPNPLPQGEGEHPLLPTQHPQARALMALPAGFLDELRTRTPLAAIVGRRVRLARSGRQWKGCCPFHGEKTPSFYVYEDGHYHCFGCGAHGDAIGFVMQSEGAGFMEAVERLAAEAGLSVPKPSPEAAEAERKRLDLGAVLEVGPGQLPPAPVPARRPPRAGLPSRPRPDRTDDPPLRSRLVRRGQRRACRRSRPRRHHPGPAHRRRIDAARR